MKVNKNKPRKLYSIYEAAEVRNVPATALSTWIKSGEIRSIKAGKRSYLTLEALDAFIDGTGAVK